MRSRAFHSLQHAKLEHDRAVEILRVAGVTRDAQNDRYRMGVASLLELLDAEDLEQMAHLRNRPATVGHHDCGARRNDHALDAEPCHRARLPKNRAYASGRVVDADFRHRRLMKNREHRPAMERRVAQHRLARRRVS
jgi:hypothetical protein